MEDVGKGDIIRNKNNTHSDIVTGDADNKKTKQIYNTYIYIIYE